MTTEPIGVRYRRWMAIALVALVLGIPVLRYLAAWLPGESEIAQQGSHPSVIVQSKYGLVMDAAAQFKLGYSGEANCFYMEFPDSGRASEKDRTPIVWPPGTEARRHGDRFGVSVRDGDRPWDFLSRTTFWVGDLIDSGGGVTDPPDSLSNLDPRCFGTEGPREVWVLAPGPERIQGSVKVAP